MKRKLAVIILLLILVIVAISYQTFMYPKEREQYEQVDNSQVTNLESLQSRDNQEKVITALKADYQAEQYTTTQPFVAVDPFERNVLSAYVVMPIDEQASYSYTVEGKDQFTDFTQTTDKMQSDTLIVPVAGLYEAYVNKVIIDINYQSGASQEVVVGIETGSIEDEMIDHLTVDVSASSRRKAYDSLQGGFIFTAMGNGYDLSGEIRVALGQSQVAEANPLTLNDDGSFLLMLDESVEDIDLIGRVHATYEMEENYIPHHDQISASNGFTYVLTSPDIEYANSRNIFNEGHIAVYKTGKSGPPIETYNLNKYFLGNKVNNASTNQPAGTDLLHLNAITYDKPSNTVIVSSQTQNMLVGIDADDFSIKWTTADKNQGNSSGDKRLAKLENYVQSNGQHNIQVTNNPAFDDNDEQTIEVTMFNNRFCLNEDGDAVLAELSPKIGDEDVCSPAATSQVLVYRIDLQEMTVDTIFEQEIEGFASPTQGSWYQSLDYQYNYIGYSDMGLLAVADDEFNLLFTASNPLDEELEYFGYGMYRSRILGEEQLQSIQKYSDYQTSASK